MATHSSILAWRIPGMGEPGGLPSMESHRVGRDWSDLAAAAAAAVPLMSAWVLSMSPQVLNTSFWHEMLYHFLKNNFECLKIFFIKLLHILKTFIPRYSIFYCYYHVWGFSILLCFGGGNVYYRYLYINLMVYYFIDSLVVKLAIVDTSCYYLKIVLHLF